MTAPRCRAKTRGGGQCKNRPMRGGLRCRMHGGSSPQAKAGARERLAAMADPAAAALGVVLKRALERGDLVAATRAATAILDRSGHGVGAQLVGGVDLSKLNDEQLAALAAGRPLLQVLAMVPEPPAAPAPPASGSDDEWVEIN